MTRPEVEALSRSMRSRVLLLALLVLGGLAAALWSMTRKSGIGEPEDRRKIMIVTRGDGVNYHRVFEPAGFVIEVDSYDEWIAAARRVGVDSELDGVALVLELADHRGFGLVVFERPRELDLSGLELEPPPAEIDGFAERDYLVASVGDYAFPHRLTVDDPGEDPVLRLPGYGALQAVFRQELITARDDPNRPRIEELQFEHAIATGREMFERPAEFASILASTRASIEEQHHGSAAEPLVPPLTTGIAIPTPDGGILLLDREIAIISDDARTLELAPSDRVQVSWIDPEAVAAGLSSGEFERSPCPSLSKGELRHVELDRLVVASDGSAVGLAHAKAVSIWRKVGPGCEWQSVGEHIGGGPLELAPGLGPVVAARAGGRGGSSIELSTLRDDEHRGGSPRFEEEVLIEQTGRRFSKIAFVDEELLAVASRRSGAMRGSDREERMYLLDRRRPGVYLSVPVEFFAEERSIHELLVLAPPLEAAGPELLIVAMTKTGGFDLIRLGISAEAWGEFANEPPAGPELGVEGRMVSLTPAELDVEVSSEVATLYGVDVGPELILQATADGRDRSELVLIDPRAGTSRTLPGTAGSYLPRVAADGSYATLVSLTRVAISAEAHRVPRVLALR